MDPIPDKQLERCAHDLAVAYVLHPDDARAIVLRHGNSERSKAIAEASHALNVSVRAVLALCG